MREVDSSLVPSDVSAKDFATFDDEVIVTAGEITTEDIIKECSSSAKDDETEEGVSDTEDPIDDPLDVVLEKPSRSTVVGSLDALTKRLGHVLRKRRRDAGIALQI